MKLRLCLSCQISDLFMRGTYRRTCPSLLSVKFHHKTRPRRRKGSSSYGQDSQKGDNRQTRWREAEGRQNGRRLLPTKDSPCPPNQQKLPRLKAKARLYKEACMGNENSGNGQRGYAPPPPPTVNPGAGYVPPPPPTQQAPPPNSTPPVKK